MPTYNISLNPALASVVKTQIKAGKYANRSEFFRSLIRRYHVEENHLIEELSPSDADYALAETRARRSKNKIPIEQVIDEL